MQITVEVLGNLRRYLPGDGNPLVLALPPGSTVGDALRTAGVPDGVQWNASVRGRLVYADTALEDSDRVLVFAPIGGGNSRDGERVTG